MSDPAALRRRQHLLIFLTVLIDLIGFGILIPILQPLAQRFGAGDIQLAWLMGVYSLMQFIFSPIFGKISDRIGRRPVILLSLAGSTIGYLIIAFSGSLGLTQTWSIALLFGARIITGIAGASVATAQAYLSDITAPEKRSAVMGMIGAAFGLGFVIGPVIGGLTSQFGQNVPFLVAAGLSLANGLFAWRMLPESLPPEHRGGAGGERRSLAAAFREAKGTPLPRLLISNLLMVSSFSMMTTCFILILIKRFSFTEMNIGLVFGFLGIVGAFIQGGLIRRMNVDGRERAFALAGAGCMVAGLLLLPEVTPWLTLLLAILLVAVGNSLATPTLNGLASKCGNMQTYGRITGAMAGSGSLGRFIGPFVTGPLLLIQPGIETYGRAALWSAAAVMAAALIVIAGIRRDSTELHEGHKV